VLSSYDERGEEESRVTYWLTALSVNEGLDDSLFTIPAHEIPVIIDVDSQRFLKHPGLLREEWDPRFRSTQPADWEELNAFPAKPSTAPFSGSSAVARGPVQGGGPN
jgi:hypothetical protein